MRPDLRARAGVTSAAAVRPDSARRAHDGNGIAMSSPPPKDQDSDTERAEGDPSGSAGRCHSCGGRLDLLVHVEPQANGRPVNYYTCERCAQVMVRKS